MWILIKWALIDLPPWLLQALIPRGENLLAGYREHFNVLETTATLMSNLWVTFNDGKFFEYPEASKSSQIHSSLYNNTNYRGQFFLKQNQSWLSYIVTIDWTSWVVLDYSIESLVS